MARQGNYPLGSFAWGLSRWVPSRPCGRSRASRLVLLGPGPPSAPPTNVIHQGVVLVARLLWGEGRLKDRNRDVEGGVADDVHSVDGDDEPFGGEGFEVWQEEVAGDGDEDDFCDGNEGAVFIVVPVEDAAVEASVAEGVEVAVGVGGVDGKI